MSTFQDEISKSLITQFSANVHAVASQKQSRFRPYFNQMQMTGEFFAYDGIGRIEAREVLGTYAPATFDQIEHTRRKISKRRFVLNLPIDASNVRAQLLDPQSQYAQRIAEAMNRQYDRLVYQCAFADVFTGRDFETTVSAATDGVLTVDATAGLTYEKLLEIKQNFHSNDVGIEEDETLLLTITGKEHTALLQEPELIQDTYTRSYVVEKGQVNEALSIKMVHFANGVPSPIIPVVGGQRQLIAASTRGIVVGVSKDIEIKIQERTDYVETTQVQAVFEMGAVRTEGALIQKVTVTA